MKVTVGFGVFENGRRVPGHTLATDASGKVSFDRLMKHNKETIILVSLTALKEEILRGFPKNPITHVDGKLNKRLQDVLPFGKVTYSRKVVLDKVLLETYEGLLQRSPRGTGTYTQGHAVLLNLKVVAMSLSELKSWMEKAQIKEGDVIRFVNLLPYAGRLERNNVSAGAKKPGYAKMRKSTDKRKRSGAFVRRPNGAYFLTQKAISRKYKLNIPIRFEFINGKQLDFTRQPPSPTRWKFRREFAPGTPTNPAKYKGPYVYPSIRFVVSAQGLVRE